MSERDFIDALLRTDFQYFLWRCFQTLNPGMVFRPNWHLQAIGYVLELLLQGAYNRLIINAPPRSLKSVTVSVAYAAFVLGHNPRRRIIAISYGTELANKHARDFRTIVESEWYRRIFPRMKIVRSLENEVKTSLEGFRIATSVEGPLTGLGGDMFIIDDPQKPADAQSESRRNRVNQWVANTLMSRLDNKETGLIIVVMQRVHMDDLSGYLRSISPVIWELLSLPAIAEAEQKVWIGEDKFHIREAGEPLNPAHESLETLRALQREMGSYDFAAQYQQCPIPPGGAMIKREWLRYYEPPELPEKRQGARVIISVDTAAKDGAQNDWSVATVWLIYKKNFYLIDLVRGRYEYPRLRQVMLELAKKHKPSKIFIEDASTGTALGQELRRTLCIPVKPVSIERDKIGRLYVEQAKFEAGLVHFPAGAPFLAELEAELLAFPHGRHDDIVDSISQALAMGTSGHDYTYSWV